MSMNKKENYEGALKDLEIYVYENPTNASGWNMIGFASRKLGKFGPKMKGKLRT